MKYVTSKNLRVTAPVTAGIITSLLIGFFINSTEAEVNVLKEVSVQDVGVYLSTTTVPLRVSGVVEAVNSTVVFAEVSGVVVGVMVKEGSAVSKSELLTRQSSPVGDAKLHLATEGRVMTEVQNELNVSVSDIYNKQSGVRTYSVSEIALLRNDSNDNRISEATELVLNNLEQTILVAIDSLNYVNQNRFLFDASGLKVFDLLIVNLYGKIPNYFQGGLGRSIHSDVDLLFLLNLMKSKESLTFLEVQTISDLAQDQLEALGYIFSTGENDIFDRHSSVSTDSDQSEYLNYREKVLSAEQSLIGARSNFQKTVDTVLEGLVSQDVNIKISVLDEELVNLQYEYSVQIALQADILASATEAVAQAERSLSQVTAPFAGVVSKVFVNKGEYVLPGTPLLRLVGSEAIEVMVTVPSQFLSGIKIGQSFFIEGELIGFVDRFSSVVESGSSQVVISLIDINDIFVGTSLSGDLSLDGLSDVYQVPRTHMHFDADGSYVVYETEEKARVDIVYDDGYVYFIKVNKKQSIPLLSTNSISF